jgi:integration host factor subunit alpha
MSIMHCVHEVPVEVSFQYLCRFDNAVATRRTSTLRRRSLQRKVLCTSGRWQQRPFSSGQDEHRGATMTGKTITRADLTAAVYKTVGSSQAEAARLVDQVIREISTALVNGEHVKLSGFGVFTVRQKSRRVGRNPKTNVEVPIEPCQSLTFSSSPLLRACMNSGTPEPRLKEPHRLAQSVTE